MLAGPYLSHTKIPNKLPKISGLPKGLELRWPLLIGKHHRHITTTFAHKRLCYGLKKHKEQSYLSRSSCSCLQAEMTSERCVITFKLSWFEILHHWDHSKGTTQCAELHSDPAKRRGAKELSLQQKRWHPPIQANPNNSLHSFEKSKRNVAWQKHANILPQTRIFCLPRRPRKQLSVME